MGEVQREVRGVGAAQGDMLLEGLDAEIALLLYTSGSTGVPKGALIKHICMIEGAHAMNNVLHASSEDVSIFIIPLSHAFGLMCFIATIATGGRAVLVESTFSIEPVVDAISRYRATFLHGSPTLFTILLKSNPTCLSLLRTGFVAGAHCPPHVLEQLDTLGCRILNLYGMTEIGAATFREAGADITVSVNLISREILPTWSGAGSSPRTSVRMLDTLLEVMDLAQMDASIRSAEQADVVITPRFGPATWRDFHLADLFMAAGREAVEEQLATLSAIVRPQKFV